jgi:hypothetical protein
LEILTSSLFPEANCYFQISHKVDLEIRKALNEKVKPALRLSSREEGFEFINLMVSTDSNTNGVEVKGPDYNRKDNIINWGLWLPYKEIVNSENQVIPYLQFYFDAAVLLFRNYGISEEIIRAIQEDVSGKVIGNSDYEYEDDSIEYDFSEFDTE